MHVHLSVENGHGGIRILAGSHGGEAMEIAVVTLDGGRPIVVISGNPATVDADRLIECLAMAREIARS